MILLRAVKPPADSDASKVKLEFEDNGIVVEKTAIISGCVFSICTNDQLRHEAAYQILKKAREAERDIALKRYGDDWRRHVTWGRFWAESMTEPERLVVDDAIAMLCGKPH